jgi:hypothetical protein
MSGLPFCTLSERPNCEFHNCMDHLGALVRAWAFRPKSAAPLPPIEGSRITERGDCIFEIRGALRNSAKCLTS